MTEFNINDTVMVRLTEYGKAKHRESHEKFYKQLGMNVEYTAPKEDEDGWSKWQLWDLMSEFGQHISLGGRVPFETTIRLANK